MALVQALCEKYLGPADEHGCQSDRSSCGLMVNMLLGRPVLQFADLAVYTTRTKRFYQSAEGFEAFAGLSEGQHVPGPGL